VGDGRYRGIGPRPHHDRARHSSVYKVFTGKVPFHNSIPATVVVDVLSGGRPDRPTKPSLTDDLWDLTERCWNHDPRRRPEILEVVLRLRTLFTHAELDGTTLGSVRQDEIAFGELSFFPSSTTILSEVGRVVLRHVTHLRLHWRFPCILFSYSIFECYVALSPHPFC